MKIIHDGPSDKWWVGKMAVCTNCLCILELEEGDDIKQLPIPFEIAVCAACPKCSSRISVSYSPPTLAVLKANG